MDKKGVFVAVLADWCPHCQVFIRDEEDGLKTKLNSYPSLLWYIIITNRDSKIKSIDKSESSPQLSADKSEKISKEYVKHFPTFLFFTENDWNTISSPSEYSGNNVASSIDEWIKSLINSKSTAYFYF